MTFPTVEVTYGDSLRKAVRTGQSGNGVFRFADNTAMLTVAENQSEQEMIFTPFNPNYKTVMSSVPVTVLPRSLQSVRSEPRKNTDRQLQSIPGQSVMEVWQGMIS